MYSICIRQERGFCSITYTPIEDNEQESTGWALDKDRTCIKDDSLCRGESFCSLDYLVIPQGKSDPSSRITFDRFCGVALTDAVANDPVQNVPITSNGLLFLCSENSFYFHGIFIALMLILGHALPFVVHFKTSSSNAGMDRGFRLAYLQNVC